MPRFDLDAQRALVCLFGLLGLMGEAVAYYVTHTLLPDILTGAFLTMAIGPVATSTVERYRQQKGSGPPDPPKAEAETEDAEEDFRRQHGYYECQAVTA